MDLYHYSSLADGEVRILSLEPSEFLGDPIRVMLKHAPLPATNQTTLSTAVEYEAISYAWGCSDRTENIIVNNTYTLSVTRSSYEALQHFQYSMEWRNLWIDAICINQDDMAEKSVQVASMGEIYKGAKDILVWLGPAQGRECLAFAMLKVITYHVDCDSSELEVANRLVQAQHDEDFVTDAEDFIIQPQQDFRCACCPRTTFKDARETFEMAAGALGSLLHRSWFHRLWVAQEVGLATGDVWIHCGTHMVSFRVLHNLGEWHNYGLGGGGKSPRPWFMAQCAGSALTNAASMSLVHQQVLEHDSDFMSMLDQTWHLQCSNSLDRIYAIRAITDVAQWNSVVVNYSTPRSVLYQEVMREYLANSFPAGRKQPAALLALAPRTISATGSPSSNWQSWVPDFDKLDQSCSDKIHRYQEEELQVFPLDYILIKSNSNNTICLAGHTFGRIKRVLERSRISASAGCSVVQDVGDYVALDCNSDIDKFRAWAKRCTSFIRCFDQSLDAQLCPCRESSCTPANASSTFNSDSCLVKNGHGGVFSIEKPSRCHNIEHQALTVLMLLSEGSDLSIESIFTLLQWSGGPLDDIEPDRVLTAIEVSGKVFIGWVPEASQPGDQICVIRGAPMPFIIRQVTGSDTYRLLGDAFFPGLREADTRVVFNGPEQFITLC